MTLSAATERFQVGDHVTIPISACPNLIWTVVDQKDEGASYQVYEENYSYVWIAARKLVLAPALPCEWCQIKEKENLNV